MASPWSPFGLSLTRSSRAAFTGSGRNFSKPPAEHGDLPEQRTAEVRVRLPGHQEHRLDLRIEVPVHQRHRELVFHVAGGPQAAQRHPGADLPCERHRQACERLHRDVAEPGDDLSHQLDALLLREERRLFRVDADADHEPVEDPAAALDHVEVAAVNGVEHAGVDGDVGDGARAAWMSPEERGAWCVHDG